MAISYPFAFVVAVPATSRLLLDWMVRDPEPVDEHAALLDMMRDRCTARSPVIRELTVKGQIFGLLYLTIFLNRMLAYTGSAAPIAVETYN